VSSSAIGILLMSPASVRYWLTRAMTPAFLASSKMPIEAKALGIGQRWPSARGDLLTSLSASSTITGTPLRASFSAAKSPTGPAPATTTPSKSSTAATATTPLRSPE
jgi:hypothetical protein